MTDLRMVPPSAAHAPRKWLSVVPHANGRIDPEKSHIECEAPGCHNPVTPARSYSYVVTVSLATTGMTGVPAYQCEHEQHFCCSPQCAVRATAACTLALYQELDARVAAPPAGEE